MSATAIITETTSFDTLAADTAHGGFEVAKLLALAFSASTDWHEFFACSRFLRAVNAASMTLTKPAPLAAYLDGRHFYGVDTQDASHFEDCKASAWLFREKHDF